MLNRLLERIDVDVIIDFQGGGQHRIDLLNRVDCRRSLRFSGRLLRLDMGSYRGRRRKRLASVVARSAAATSRTYSRGARLCLADRPVVRLNCGRVLPPFSLLS